LHSLIESDADGLVAAVQLIATELALPDSDFSIHLHSRLPRAMGLGSSAAFAVAIARALARAYGLQAGDDRVNQIAFQCEKLAHGTPSGVDNTLACYGRPVLFHRDAKTHINELSLPAAPPVVVAYGEQAGLTRQQVAGVRARRKQSPLAYERLFDEMDALCLAATDALQASDYDGLGACMNIGQGLLNAIEVSTPELEYMVSVARRAGALGAKLTGAGGGGSIVALCPGTKDQVALALRNAGFRTLEL
jgi:hydroxymethylglutaryl-CoA reductase